MNANRIQRLSGEYEELTAFYSSCCYETANLFIEGGGVPSAALTTPPTKRIIVAVRKALLEEIEVLEKEIKKEAGV